MTSYHSLIKATSLELIALRVLISTAATSGSIRPEDKDIHTIVLGLLRLPVDPGIGIQTGLERVPPQKGCCVAKLKINGLLVFKEGPWKG